MLELEKGKAIAIAGKKLTPLKNKMEKNEKKDKKFKLKKKQLK